MNSFFSFYDLSVCLPDLNKLHIVSGLLAGPHHYCFHIKKCFGFSIRVICDQESKRLKRAAELQGRKGSRWSLRWGALRSATPINETAGDNIEYSCMMSEFWWSSHEIFLGSFLFAYVDDAAGRYNVTFLRLCWYKITLFFSLLRQVVWKHCCPFILALMVNGIFLLNSL